MAKHFHPEAWKQANATTTATETTEQPTSETTNGTSPGFGVTAAVVGLLGAVFLARRQ
ncbi:PGF-CTERM sorting domain-containing protein [Halospeciosus flavus]